MYCYYTFTVFSCLEFACLWFMLLLYVSCWSFSKCFLLYTNITTITITITITITSTFTITISITISITITFTFTLTFTITISISITITIYITIANTFTILVGGGGGGSGGRVILIVVEIVRSHFGSRTKGGKVFLKGARRRERWLGLLDDARPPPRPPVPLHPR